MKKQFEILEELEKITKDSISSISELRLKIEQETQKIKSKLLDLYDNDLEVLYLVDFYSNGLIHFHKASKDKLSTITLNWYDSKFRYKVPKNYEEGLKAINEYPTPTNCEIHSYNSFGYFHDIEARYDRIDWIAEKTRDKCYLFQIKESDFIKALDAVHNYYSNNKSKDLLPDEVQTNQQKLQYIKDIGLLKDLQHHKDTTVGLYAFDQEIDIIFDDVLGIECKTIIEQLMLDKINYLRSIVFKIK